MLIKCALCDLSCTRDPIVEDQNAFCCNGCLTVYRILEAQHFTKEPRSHPLFQQALKSGVISNPDLHEQVSPSFDGEETKRLHLEIEEMWCPSCAEAICLILLGHKGIKRCVIDYATDLAMIEYSPFLFSKEDIFRWIKRLGYTPRPFLDEEHRSNRTLWIRFVLSAFCALNLMMIALPIYTMHFGFSIEGYSKSIGWLSFGLAIPLITYGTWPVWRRFLLSLRTYIFGMETLVLIGASTAFLYSTICLFRGDFQHLYYDSMGMLIACVLLGKILERRAKFSAKKSLYRITRSLPKKGMKWVDAKGYCSVPIKEIKKGDRILTRTGEKVILDGEVIEGEGLVDASIMTGEAAVVRVKSGSQLVGGSIVKQGILHSVVSADIHHSILAKIFEVIEQDMRTKREKKGVIDRLTPYFVPFVLALACIAYPLGGILRVLSVLLISCPCAIGIAVPLVESRLLEYFSKKGALVKNRTAFSILAQNPLFVFDKTGTLTEGKFTVLSGLGSLNVEHQAILKGFTENTTHPLAAAIGRLIEKSVCLSGVQEYIGLGMEGMYQEKRYLIGSCGFFKQRGIAVPEAKGTVVHFAEGDCLLTTLCLGDKLHADIPKVDGVILSGDSKQLVADIAKQCGFRWGKGGCDPLQKRIEIEKLKKPVVMVGDGVNDAPALCAADVGISVVSATDISIEVSDILLTQSSLSILPELVKIAQKGERVIKQNVFWAFIYNGVGLSLALTGHLTPLFAVSAMLLSSICIVLNSMRL